MVRARLGVHQERLADATEREQQRKHWQGVVNAQNSLDSSAADRPSTIAQQQAVIAGLDARAGERLTTGLLVSDHVSWWRVPDLLAILVDLVGEHGNHAPQYLRELTASLANAVHNARKGAA